jgi:starch phosphorylase
MGGRIAFIQDYDMNLARFLVQGVDVWLNTPCRPHEASGTSGQKAAANGVPNLSVLDGWWAEGYDGSNGWAIDPGEQRDDPAAQDAADAEALYRLLEDEVAPLFYQRDADNVPRGWVQVMKAAIRTAVPIFCTRRMVKEYTERFYIPAARAANNRA